MYPSSPMRESTGRSLLILNEAMLRDCALSWIVEEVSSYRGRKVYGLRVEYSFDPVPLQALDDTTSRRKTELCRLHLVHKDCQFADECWFAHGANDLRPITRNSRYKTRPCRSYSQGRECKYGTRCNYIHETSAHAMLTRTFTVEDLLADETAADGDQSTPIRVSTEPNVVHPNAIHRRESHGASNGETPGGKSDLPLKSPWRFPTLPPNKGRVDCEERVRVDDTSAKEKELGLEVAKEMDMDAVIQWVLNGGICDSAEWTVSRGPETYTMESLVDVFYKPIIPGCVWRAYPKPANWPTDEEMLSRHWLKPMSRGVLKDRLPLLM